MRCRGTNRDRHAMEEEGETEQKKGKRENRNFEWGQNGPIYVQGLGIASHQFREEMEERRKTRECLNY